MSTGTAAAPERLEFKTELTRLLDLIIHSLYTKKEIFLRELISNAADAIDKVRFESLTHPELLEGDGDFKIRIIPDKNAGTLTVSDNGIGMSRGRNRREPRHHRPIRHQGIPRKTPNRQCQGSSRADWAVRCGVLCLVHGGGSRNGDFARGRTAHRRFAGRATGRGSSPSKMASGRAGAPTSSSISAKMPRNFSPSGEFAKSSSDTPISSPIPSSWSRPKKRTGSQRVRRKSSTPGKQSGFARRTK